MSSSTKKDVVCLVLIGVIAFICGLVIGYDFHKEADKSDATVTDKVTKAVNPVPTNTKQVGEITLPLEVGLKEPQDPTLPPNTIILFPKEESKERVKYVPEKADSGAYSENVGTKTQYRVHIPIEQKEYKDSDYTAYVSGYHINLDSIEVHSKIITRTKTETKFRCWNIGLTGGYGYGFVSHKVEPFIGVGVTLNLFR